MQTGQAPEPVDHGPRLAEEERIRNRLKEIFPNGDPLFQEITWREQELYNAKNTDYAGGGSDPNGNFNRVASIFALYPGLSLSDPRVVALSNAMKQFDQVCWSLSRGYEGAIEGLDARLADIHVYMKIIRILNRRKEEGDRSTNGTDTADTNDE